MIDGEEAREIRRRGNPLALAVRFLLHWFVKVIVLLFLGIRFLYRKRAIRYGALAILALGAVGWNALGVSLQSTQPDTPPVLQEATVVSSVPANHQLSPALVVERYLQAQAAFDGRAMWDQISSEMKDSMEASVASLEQLQAELDAAREQGRRYRGATYVGGVPMSEGRSVYFYVLLVDSPSGSVEIPYIYIVGADGKIVSIQ